MDKEQVPDGLEGLFDTSARDQQQAAIKDLADAHSYYFKALVDMDVPAPEAGGMAAAFIRGAMTHNTLLKISKNGR